MATQSVADSSTAYHSHLATNPHQIVNDIEQYVAQGIQVFSIVDETFAPVAIEQICHQLDEKQIS
jgi:O-acetylhomoserine/O-acetylserine sulfhydrylase-like pyridoxal-dependent enzyme